MPGSTRNSYTTRRTSRSPKRKSQKPVHSLSDSELRAELMTYGVNVGPIMETTRSLYERQLEKRRQNSKSSGSLNRSSGDITNVQEERKFPTPPRPTMVPRYQPQPSYPSPSSPSSSYLSRSLDDRNDALEDNYSLISNYTRPRRPVDFSNSRGELSFSKRRNIFDDDTGDSDDDHMESSRIVTSSRAYLPGSQQSLPMLTALKNYLKSWTSCILPRQSPPTMARSYRSFPDGRPYSYREIVPTRRSIFGFDISRALLISLLSVFGFLTMAYIVTANSGVIVQSARVIYVAGKDTILFLYTYAILPLLVLALVCGAVVAIYMLRQYQIKKKAEEKRLMFDLIEKITDIIRDANEQGQVYVAEPHVRDMLLPPSQRMRDSPEWRRWQEAVKFINLNESRVSTETRIVGGVECSVWRWIPAKKNGWQGSAFDRSMRLNMPDQAPSHCLKLRGMFSSSNDPERMNLDVEEALLQKVAPIEPLHVHIESDSKEGLVFARFASLSDCSRAFKALHGTWFNGQLVWAKFLRDERYEQRFPNAPRQ